MIIMNDKFSNRKIGTVEMIVAMLISGSIGLFVIKSEQTPINIVFFRCAISTICLIPICFFYGYFKEKFFSKKELFLMVTSGLFIVINWVLLFAAFPKTSISLATIVYHINPFIILFSGVIVFHEKINRSDILWTFIAFIGLVIIIGFGNASFNYNEFFGLLLVIIATTLYSISVLITKKLSQTPPLLIVLIQTISGTLIIVPFVTLTESALGSTQWLYVISLGIIHTALLYFLMYSALKKIPLSNIAILSFIYPLSTVAIDYFYFNHTLTKFQLAGAVFILIAVLGVKLHWKIPFVKKQNNF